MPIKPLLILSTTTTKTLLPYLHQQVRLNQTHCLKTAIAPVEYENISAEAYILPGKGTQRSFVTEEFARTLILRTDGRESLQFSLFGGGINDVRYLKKSTEFIKSDQGQRIPIEVLIVPKIAMPLQNHLRELDRKSNYLKGLNIAHPI